MSVVSKLIKHPDEVRLYDFDFSAMPEIIAGDTINGLVAITSTRFNGSGSLTIGSGIINGALVQFTIGSGNDGDEFLLECKVSTLAGRTLVGCGNLDIRKCF